jgi:GTP-binding protein
MEIKSAYFFKSARHFHQLPAADKPEFSFVGRSNVGKSSIINRLVNHKGLAKTSGTPGKTQLINHFIVNGSWYLVDLPGYGYAKVSKKTRVGFENMIRDYVTRRQNLISLFVLIDSRHEPQKLDLEFMEYLGISQVPFSIIFTKIDKLSKSQLHTKVEAYKSALLEQWDSLPPMFLSSAETGEGCEEILNYIAENMQYFRTA